MPRYVFPMDPNCPVWNEQVSGLLDDPMTSAMGAPVDDILEGWEKKHRVSCKRCQEYGAANVEVDTDYHGPDMRGYGMPARR